VKLRIAEVFKWIRAVLHPFGGAAQKWGKSTAGIPSRKPITQEQVQEWRAQIENSDRFCDGDARGRLTISSTTDGQLITNYGTTKLPIIGTQVPILGFYCFMPMILLAFFLYFHLYLQRLWEALATLPAYFPDGRRLDEKSHPWLLTDLARSHFPRLQEKSVALSFAQSSLSILLAYWVVPITLVAIWFRLLPLHYWNLITFHILVLAFGIGFGLYCVANRWNAFHDLPARFGLMSRFVHFFSVGKSLPAGIVIGVAFLVLSLLALMTYQRPRELRGISGLSNAPISVLSLNGFGLRWPALSAGIHGVDAA
jgi:hypothetical protein